MIRVHIPGETEKVHFLMPCYFPIDAWRSKVPNDNGKYPLVFNARSGEPGSELQVSCNQCIGCRLERSRQWAVRCVHEQSLYLDNSFITLTYDPAKAPPGGNLVKKDFQDFMKRLRFSIGDRKIRYFACGEYGSDDSQPTGLGHPHFHAIIFNYGFPDREYWRTTNNGDTVYRSPELELAWANGFCEIGEVTFNSAAYVARYCTKKINGDMAESHYIKVDHDTGELYEVEKEFQLQSIGIGKDWWKKYKTDTDKDFIFVNGHKLRPPRYYDRLSDQDDERSGMLADLKYDRACSVDPNNPDVTIERLRARNEVQIKKQQHYSRSL